MGTPENEMADLGGRRLAGYPDKVWLTTADGQDVLTSDNTFPVTVFSAAPAIATNRTNSYPQGIRLLDGTTVATTSRSLDRGSYRGPAALVITNVGGATPTETIDIQGSVDGVNFYNVAYALVATPNTVAVAQITVTTTATTTYLLLPDQSWRYLRIVTATITNETTTATYFQ